VLAASVAADLPWLWGPLGAAMAAHFGRRGRIEGRQQQLHITAAGVTLSRPGRRPHFVPWHLFERARIEPPPDANSDGAGPPSWRLTLVNAYKPTISSYLHRRGTDAPIFAECVQFEFSSTPGEARRLERRLNRAIDRAGARFRVLDLASMELDPPDPERLLHLQTCPRCDAALPDRHGRCPACDLRYGPDMFLLRGTPASMTPWLAAAAILGFMIAGGLLMTHRIDAALGVAVVSVVALCWALLRRGAERSRQASEAVHRCVMHGRSCRSWRSPSWRAVVSDWPSGITPNGS
jgi:hypothetical protein